MSSVINLNAQNEISVDTTIRRQRQICIRDRYMNTELQIIQTKTI